MQLSDRHQAAADKEHRKRHLEPVARQITDRISDFRAQLASSTALPASPAATPTERSERSAVVTGLLIALAMPLGTPEDLRAADDYARHQAAL
ncbi:hypothetical protein ACIBL5_05945 [Streptomyces sp. NPDC050516]|uniref:hypothetical protein n=1 Tax=Streptomyces sp. NPDC050516 TaxID=3365621 RepID=UPI00379FE84C